MHSGTMHLIHISAAMPPALGILPVRSFTCLTLLTDRLLHATSPCAKSALPAELSHCRRHQATSS